MIDTLRVLQWNAARSLAAIHSLTPLIANNPQPPSSLDLLPLPSAFGRALAPTAECRQTEAFLHPQATNQQTSQPAPRRQHQQLL